MVYLGVNIGHGASAALMVKGEVVLTFQEERFTNVKNFVGYPKKSIQACLDFAKEKEILIDHCGLSTINHLLFVLKYPLENYYTIENWIDYYLSFFSKQTKISYTIKNINKLKKFKKIDQYIEYSKIKKSDYFNYKLTRNLFYNFLKKQSKGIINKISYIDHHTCHAYYAAHAQFIKEKKSAILTIDSEGDGLNQTLWILDKKKITLKI